MSWGVFDSLMMAVVLKQVRACFEADRSVEIKGFFLKRAPGSLFGVFHVYLIVKSIRIKITK